MQITECQILKETEKAIFISRLSKCSRNETRVWLPKASIRKIIADRTPGCCIIYFVNNTFGQSIYKKATKNPDLKVLH